MTPARALHDRRASGDEPFDVLTHRSDAMTPPVLTPRELEALRYRALGYTSAGAGAQMGITESTVKNMLNLVFRRHGAMCLADELRIVGWLQVPDV